MVSVHLEHAVALLLPSRCLLCARPLPVTASEGGVCPPCWTSIVAQPEVCCPRCASSDVAEPDVCLDCRTAPPPWQGAACVGPYQGALRELILLLKTARRDELAIPLARRAAAVWQRTGWPRPDLVVPVPTTWVRLLRRGYNHAELVSRHLAGLLGCPHRPALHRSSRGTQRGRSRRQRLALATSSFRVRGTVAGTVLLVDDVLTTGATAGASSRALLHAGAESVRVLTLARTPSPRRSP